MEGPVEDEELPYGDYWKFIILLCMHNRELESDQYTGKWNRSIDIIVL
jgi:hypothetical protein